MKFQIFQKISALQRFERVLSWISDEISVVKKMALIFLLLENSSLMHEMNLTLVSDICFYDVCIHWILLDVSMVLVPKMRIHNACIHDACILAVFIHDACIHDACIHDACIHNAYP